MSKWEPEQYLKFQGERTQPAIDLASRIDLCPESIIDIGCGPGNSTFVLRAKWAKAKIIGLDSSEEMIEKARKDYPNEQWMLGDASCLKMEEDYDLVFSNAAIQWVPDHARLIPSLFRMVRPGGALAVQVPANYDSPLHEALLNTVRDDRWRGLLGEFKDMVIYHDADFYYDLLAPIAKSVQIWVTSYYHVLSSQYELIEWYKSTGMKPFLQRLPDDDLRAKFEMEVLDRCRQFYPVHSGGNVLYPFKRLFFIADK